MEFDETDNEVIKLLTQLKNAEGAYPAEMMASRRQSYMNQIAGLGIGAGAAGVLKHVVKGGGGSAVPPIASTLLETALIIAIVAEAGAVAFINRQKVSELFRTISAQPKVETVSTPLEIASPLVELKLTSTLYVTETATPIGTPSPAIFSSTTVASDDENTQSNATPSVSNGNNGNHYGQTPEPSRTKDPGKGEDKKPKKETKK
jgi:hypothetical protein